MTQEAISKLFFQMLEASVVTGKIFILTIIFSLPLALIVAKGRMSKLHLGILHFNAPVRLYLLVMRGTPLILRLLFVYFAPYWLFEIRIDRFTAAILAMTLNYAAYFA